MKKSETPDEHRQVLRYFYGALAIVTVSALALVLFVYLSYAVEVRARDAVERFHTRSLMLTNEISGSLARLQSELLEPEESHELHSAARAQIISSFAAVTRVLESVVALQLEYGDSTFAGTVERVRRRHDQIRGSLTAGTFSAMGLRRDLDALSLSIRQLHQLHSIAVEDTLRDLTAIGWKRTWGLILVVGLVVLATWRVLTRVLRLLRAQLREQLQTEEALLRRERQLQHSQKIQALGTLVGGVAHDFNNLLTAILGNTGVLATKLAADDPRSSYAEEIRKAGERAAALTRQLLAFSRLDTVQMRIVDLNLMVRDMHQLLRRLIPENIRLLVDCEDDIGSVRVDRVQMEQVLMNLVTNARDSLSGDGTLTIRTGNADVAPEELDISGVPPGRYCRLTVEDDGCGMTPEVRSRLFEPFYTTKDRGSGTGLGLATAHGVVTKSEGYLLVDSEPGRGSMFDVYLPYQDIAAGETDSVDAIAETPGGSETLLIVEDDEQVRDLTATGLRAQGYDVLERADGSEALRIFEADSTAIQLVVSDVILPGISGPALVRRLREIRADVGVVFVSGYADETALKEVRDGNDPFLPKPFELDKLFRLVRHELDRCCAREMA